MYNDYEVIYKSNINGYLIYWIILGIIGIAIILFMFFSLSKVYKKANRSGLAPWIPIYNAYEGKNVASIIARIISEKFHILYPSTVNYITILLLKFIKARILQSFLQDAKILTLPAY